MNSGYTTHLLCLKEKYKKLAAEIYQRFGASRFEAKDIRDIFTGRSKAIGMALANMRECGVVKLADGSRRSHNGSLCKPTEWVLTPWYLKWMAEQERENDV